MFGDRQQSATGLSGEGVIGLERTRPGDVELEFTVRGSGAPVLLVHASFFADWFAPLLAESHLADRYRVISYHRVGYAGSSHPPGPLSVADQAAHARALLEHLGVDRAHVVGHSFGGNIALQLALQLALDPPRGSTPCRFWSRPCWWPPPTRNSDQP